MQSSWQSDLQSRGNIAIQWINRLLHCSCTRGPDHQLKPPPVHVTGPEGGDDSFHPGESTGCFLLVGFFRAVMSAVSWYSDASPHWDDTHHAHSLTTLWAVYVFTPIVMQLSLKCCNGLYCNILCIHRKHDVYVMTQCIYA